MHRKIRIAAQCLTAALLLSACAQQPTAAAAAPLPELKIGSAVSAPYFYIGRDGSYTGVDKDIADEACARLGYTPVYVELVWGEESNYLSSGTVDCFWSCFSMLGREAQYQWAGPYMESPEVVVVAADSNIKTADDLAGKTISVRTASNVQMYFVALPADAQPAIVSTFSNIDDAFVTFGQGFTSAVAGHKATLQQYTSQQPDLYRYLEPALFTAELGVAFDKNYDADVVAALDRTLAEMRSDGTIAAIAERYGLSAADIGEAGNANE